MHEKQTDRDRHKNQVTQKTLQVSAFLRIKRVHFTSAVHSMCRLVYEIHISVTHVTAG